MSKEPKYRQVEESIRQMIQLGTLKVGEIGRASCRERVFGYV